MIITLDGPAGSGKSATARALAKRLGAFYLDTGAMYRSVALRALERKISPSDGAGLEKLASEIDIHFLEGEGGQRVVVDGADRTLDIRRPAVDGIVSAVSSHKGVRGRMVLLQRKVAAEHADIVVEGRDAGSVVFPDAERKIYLSASAEARAGRRARQNEELGIGSGDTGVEIKRRDEADSGREVSPLVVPAGATVLDNTNLSLDETVEKIIGLLA